jgi:hypothetical protein
MDARAACPLRVLVECPTPPHAVGRMRRMQIRINRGSGGVNGAAGQARDKYAEADRVAKRFYCALALYELIEEVRGCWPPRDVRHAARMP